MDISLISRHGRGLNMPHKRDVSEQDDVEQKGYSLINSTLELLEQGEKEIKLDDKHKDVILILGNTGSGKSTFTQWLAGDNTKLISKETTEGSDEYIIVDSNRISDTTLKSKTIFPELVIDAKTNSAFYDCPGFSDTQGTSHDIAETYFIKKVVDFSKSVKMIFVINHFSVKKGVDRQDFMKLLRHVTDLVKEIEKFKNSIAMVATKVDAYSRRGLIEDKFVITAIADFLQEAKQYLMEESSTRPNLSKKEKRFYKNAIKFVEFLLEKENDQYTRIGIFRRPDGPGPVSEIELLQNNKKTIERILHEKLTFTSKNDEDFGYTVSEKTKNDISDIVKEINKKLESSLNIIAIKIQEYFKNLVEDIRSKIRLLASETYNSNDVNFSNAEAFRNKLNIGYIVTSDLMNKTKNLTNPEELSVIVGKAITSLDINIPKHEIVKIEKQGKYFNFLQTVSDKMLGSKPWDQLFRDLKIFLSDSKTAVSRDATSVAENINNRLQNNLNDTAKTLQEKYNESIKSLEIQKLPEKLSRDSRFISELTQEIEKGTTIEKLVNSIHYVADNLGVSLPKENLNTVGNQGRCLRFLEIISNKSLVKGKTAWLPPFKNIAKYFSESEKWYRFLEHLYNKLSEYSIQKDRQRYNVADLDHWGQPDKTQGISVTNYNFQKFLNKIESYNVPEYQTVKKLTATSLQVEELNQVLSLTLKHRPTVRCSERHIIVKGKLIVLSEIMHNLKSNLDTNNSCEDFEDQIEAGNYNLFKIFALNRVFIDTDLPFSKKEVSVAIIAPKWEVIGSRSINLSGADGSPHWRSKAKNGDHPGNNGANGASGRNGESAESFFGVGGAFVNGAKLKIIANGGSGGPGQEGGDGCPGTNGKDAPVPTNDDPICDYSTKTFRGFRCELIYQEPYDQLSSTEQYNFKIYGEHGGKGGDGGDGGKGGKGGDLGNIVILELRRPSKIIKLTSVGEEGGIGKGGAGGQGGKDGNNQLGKFTEKKDYFSCAFTPSDCKYHTSWEYRGTEIITSRGPNGSNGKDGRNYMYIERPKAANGISSQSNIINEYKSYLRENINNRFQKISIVSFLNLLNSKTDARKLYGVPYLLNSSNYVKKRDEVLALFNEFQGLEEQFPELGDQIDFFPFYTSLLESVNAYIEDQKDIQIDRKKVLNYIYTATLGKIYYLMENSDKLLIINMQAYLDMIEDNIKTLKDLQVISNKVDVINKYKENYKSGIEKKINEAQSLIQKQINPEIERINAEIDDQISSLIQETISLQRQSEKDYEELAKKKKSLENALTIKGIFNCLKIIGGVAILMGPYGQIAVTVINAISSVAEPLALNKEKESINIPEGIETSLNNLKDNIKTLRGKKIDHLDKLLKNVEEEIKNNSETLSDLTSKIEDIRDKLQKVRDNELDFMHLKVLETELEENIKRKEVDLKKVNGDKKTIDASEALEKIIQVFKFGSLFSEIFGKCKEDKEEMDTVKKSMQNMSDTIEMLNEYEKSVYDTIAPMLQNMEDEIKDISAKLKTKSHLALNVTKWQVQSSLKDMKLLIQKLTEGLGIKNDLSRTIEKFDEVVTTLINIYDRIQSYQYQQNLANYISDISSVAASNITIEDQQLAYAVNHLEFVIRANLVIEHYKSAIDALRQWVFPFSDHYIEKSMLPSQLQMDTNIENLVQTATGQIETIRQKLHLYDTSIMKGDQFLQCEEFSSQYFSSQPFYVWENEENRKSISSLLSGKEVILRADINESALDKEAIKFSEIEFDFKIKNETTQSLLSEILRGFDIKATHLGNSYYRYKGEIFLISSDSVTFSYSYEKNDDGIPIRSNEEYNSFKSGDLLLSPYTLWQVRLMNPTNKSSFQDLDEYKNEINVELSGLGTFTLKNASEFAENNSSTVENDPFENNTAPSYIRLGLSECKRFKYRSTRSVKGIAVDDSFMSNGASKDVSSPIVSLFNFLKTYFVSNLVISINQAFFGEQTSVRNDCSELSDECTETRNNGPRVIPIPSVTDIGATFSEDHDSKEGIERKSDTIFDVNFHENNCCLKSFLINDQKCRSNNHSTQIPDLNCSLLLADLVTRTITHNKYKSPIDESLLSPREVMLRGIVDGVVRDESEVKRMLHRHLSEKEENSPSSWFGKLKGYAKSVIQVLGFEGYDDTEEYVQDLRHLFA